MVKVLAKPVTPLFTAHRKYVFNVYHSNDVNRPRPLDQSENTRICEALFKTKTLEADNQVVMP